ncbi:hypothetical protein BT93_H1007 [Corymbia citriodora subsp. variegata]|nr:hypothetical protein BT93_H1007 [Corymbia citriodora subsp. variegata]
MPIHCRPHVNIRGSPAFIAIHNIRGSPAFIALHTILVFLVTALLNLVQIKFQGKPASPFDTHPFDTFLALFCLLFYGAFALVTVLSLVPAFYALAFHVLMMLTGLLLVASLAALLIPGPFHCFPYLLYFMLLSVVLLYMLARTLLMWVQQKLESMLDPVFHSYRLHGGRALPLLPVTVMVARSAPELGIAWGLARLDAANVPQDARD